MIHGVPGGTQTEYLGPTFGYIRDAQIHAAAVNTRQGPRDLVNTKQQPGGADQTAVGAEWQHQHCGRNDTAFRELQFGKVAGSGLAGTFGSQDCLRKRRYHQQVVPDRQRSRLGAQFLDELYGNQPGSGSSGGARCEARHLATGFGQERWRFAGRHDRRITETY